jgi:hypothetical protein
MKEKNLYNTLEIPGSFLVPGFSIYVLEISRGFDTSPKAGTTQPPEKWFYIGMTGDPHYPSARAAFHRISGHLELSSRSTQNQLMLALQKLGIKDEKSFNEITIKMHHYPIAGFKRITEKILSKETVKELKLTDEYKSYQKARKKVLELENALIFKLKDKLLNKTSGLKPKTIEIPYPEIYESIIKLVNNGLALSLSKGEL